MRKSLAFGVLVVALLAIPAQAGGARKEAQAQVQFGIDVAQKGLWKEALYR